jgi:hypothetical protein
VRLVEDEVALERERTLPRTLSSTSLARCAWLRMKLPWNGLTSASPALPEAAGSSQFTPLHTAAQLHRTHVRAFAAAGFDSSNLVWGSMNLSPTLL